jgi:hypothetical protein
MSLLWHSQHLRLVSIISTVAPWHRMQLAWTTSAP